MKTESCKDVIYTWIDKRLGQVVKCGQLRLSPATFGQPPTTAAAAALAASQANHGTSKPPQAGEQCKNMSTKECNNWVDSNDASERMHVVTEDTLLCEIHTTCLPWTSSSFRNHRMLAAGLLPEVVHIRVTMSPSIAGLENPVISGRTGTPVLQGN